MAGLRQNGQLLFTVAMLAMSVAVSALAQSQPVEQANSYAFLDQHSRYGHDWFPQPLVAPELDRSQQVREDWNHAENSDVLDAQVDASIGMLTLEARVPYIHDQSAGLLADTTLPTSQEEDGLGLCSLSARHPVYQYVSPDDYFDYTLIASFTVAWPTQTKVNPDTNISPRLSQLIRFGEHASLQTSIGYTNLIGPERGGNATLEYNGVLGYSLDQDDLPLLGITCTTPLLELKGEQGLSGEDSGINRIFGTLGVRLNLHPMGNYRPRLGFGYSFPVNQEAREVFRWAIITSLVLEF